MAVGNPVAITGSLLLLVSTCWLSSLAALWRATLIRYDGPSLGLRFPLVPFGPAAYTGAVRFPNDGHSSFVRYPFALPAKSLRSDDPCPRLNAFGCRREHHYSHRKRTATRHIRETRGLPGIHRYNHCVGCCRIQLQLGANPRYLERHPLHLLRLGRVATVHP